METDPHPLDIANAETFNFWVRCCLEGSVHGQALHQKQLGICLHPAVVLVHYGYTGGRLCGVGA